MLQGLAPLGGLASLDDPQAAIDNRDRIARAMMQRRPGAGVTGGFGQPAAAPAQGNPMFKAMSGFAAPSGFSNIDPDRVNRMAEIATQGGGMSALSGWGSY